MSKFIRKLILIFICALLFKGSIYSQQTIFGNKKNKEKVKEEEVSKEDRKKERKAKRRKDKYIPFGLAMSIHKVKDLGVSPLIYSGIGISYNLGYIGHSERKINKFNLLYSSGSLTSRNYPEPDEYFTTMNRIDISYLSLWNLKKIEPLGMNWYVGGRADVIANLRLNPKFVNSSFAYDGFLSLGLSSRLEQPIKKKKREILRISYQLSLPIVTLATRPGYVMIPDIAANELIEFSNTSVGTFNDFLNLNSLLEISFVLKNRNIIRLGYMADYYSFYGDYNNVRAGMHSIVMTAHFNFKKI